MSLYIGIDVGTSATKLVLMDEEGVVLSEVSRAYAASYPHPGWSEQDPGLWWDAVCAGMPALLEGRDRSSVAGIACAGQMHGLVALDGAGRVIRPAILWNDGRTEEEVRYLNEEVGTTRLSGLTGNIAFAGFTAPKILWMQREEPEHFRAMRQVLLPKDYVNYRLTGTLATDVSDASGTLLFDVGRRSWSEEMLALCGMDASQVPPVHESSEAIGVLREELADAWGLSRNVVVAAGGADNACAALGTGAVGSDSMNISLGTSGTVFIPTTTFAAGVGDRIHSFCHADGAWHLMGCILSAASCNAWWCSDILRSSDYEREQEGWSEEPPSLALPYFLPYLMGERTPHNDASARGAFVGLSLSSTREQMTRAVLEGVAFAVRDSLQIAQSLGVATRRSTVCGGGARSARWLQMLADVLDLDLLLPATEQGPAFGAALLAATAAGRFSCVGEAVSSTVSLREAFSPRPLQVVAYERRYALWRGLYPSLKESFRGIS